MLTEQDFPPYIVRKSTKARHLQLRITARGQLEVVVPRRVSQKAALAYLAKNKAWVLARQHLIQAPIEELHERDWPQEIFLRAIDCQWPLRFENYAPRHWLQECQGSITVYSQEPNFVKALPLLRRWLKRKAQAEITPWLQRVSTHCKLPYKSVSYRGQQRQWGNCSREGIICLNYKLLFLPAEYVNYVLIHELCHTVHFNHSAAFWKLLEEFIPGCQLLRCQVRKGDEYLPFWIK